MVYGLYRWIQIVIVSIIYLIEQSALEGSEVKQYVDSGKHIIKSDELQHIMINLLEGAHKDDSIIDCHLRALIKTNNEILVEAGEITTFSDFGSIEKQRKLSNCIEIAHVIDDLNKIKGLWLKLNGQI